jgi:recombinational DNA repair protein RecR
MDRHVINGLGFVVEDPINIDSLDNCAICGRLTEGQICDRCKEDLYKEGGGCD